MTLEIIRKIEKSIELPVGKDAIDVYHWLWRISPSCVDFVFRRLGIDLNYASHCISDSLFFEAEGYQTMIENGFPEKLTGCSFYASIPFIKDCGVMPSDYQRFVRENRYW